MLSPFGSIARLAQRTLQNPEHADNRTLPSWLFDALLSARDRLSSSCPNAFQLTPLPIKSKAPSTPHLQHVQHTRFRGELR